MNAWMLLAAAALAADSFTPRLVESVRDGMADLAQCRRELVAQGGEDLDSRRALAMMEEFKGDFDRARLAERLSVYDLRVLGIRLDAILDELGVEDEALASSYMRRLEGKLPGRWPVPEAGEAEAGLLKLRELGELDLGPASRGGSPEAKERMVELLEVRELQENAGWKEVHDAYLRDLRAMAGPEHQRAEPAGEGPARKVLVSPPVPEPPAARPPDEAERHPATAILLAPVEIVAGVAALILFLPVSVGLWTRFKLTEPEGDAAP